MSEEQRGLYGKYEIRKVETGEMIEGFAFVLRPEKDEHARRALRAYALSCINDNPSLSTDLLHELSILDAANDCAHLGHIYEIELDRNERRVLYGCGHCGAQWEISASEDESL